MSVVAALEASRKSVKGSLRALTSLTAQSSTTLPAVLPGLPESLAQLLKQLHYQTTTLALSFKPPITLAAAVHSLDRLNDGFGRVAACVVAASGGQGGALVDEWKDGVDAIGAEILRLLDVFADAAEKSQGGVGTSNNDDNPYLVHTGLVWDAINALSKDLSGNEISAVTKRWNMQGEVMKDAWTEYKEFLEDQAGGSDNDEDEDDFGLDEDDEYAELEDMMKGEKMTPEERSRTEAAKPLIGLHLILHSTIPRYLPLLSLDPDESYSEFLQASTSLSAAFDTAVGSMYPAQDIDEIESALLNLRKQATFLTQAVRARLERSNADEEKKTSCRSFLGKWEERLGKEELSWRDKGLSVTSLGHALPR